jgi:hypothetical protein
VYRIDPKMPAAIATKSIKIMAMVIPLMPFCRRKISSTFILLMTHVKTE